MDGIRNTLFKNQAHSSQFMNDKKQNVVKQHQKTQVNNNH